MKHGSIIVPSLPEYDSVSAKWLPRNPSSIDTDKRKCTFWKFDTVLCKTKQIFPCERDLFCVYVTDQKLHGKHIFFCIKFLHYSFKKEVKPENTVLQTVVVWMYHPMRPKARGLVQHGGPPGWLEESGLAGCDFVCDGRAMPPVQCPDGPYRLPWSKAPQLRVSWRALHTLQYGRS